MPIVVGSKLFPQISDTGLSGKRPLPSYRVAEVLRLCFLSQAHFALQQRIFSTPRNENTPNVLNGRKYHARELSGVYSGCSTAHFHAIHGSDLPRLSQADGVQGQKAHPIQQRTDGSDLSLRHLRCRDQEDSQGVVEIEWAAALIGRPTEIELRNRPCRCDPSHRLARLSFTGSYEGLLGEYAMVWLHPASATASTIAPARLNMWSSTNVPLGLVARRSSYCMLVRLGTSGSKPYDVSPGHDHGSEQQQRG